MTGGVILLFAVRGHPADPQTAWVARGASRSAGPATLPARPSWALASPTRPAHPAPAAAPTTGPTTPGKPTAGNPTAGNPTTPPGTSHPALTVLNDSKINGLARRAARRFAAGGWKIALVGNLRGRTACTTVYYAPGQRDAASALARQFSEIRRVESRYAGLPGQGLTVVVTRDF